MKNKNLIKMNPAVLRHFVLLLTVFTFLGCATISSFDQYAYTQTTSLKVDAMNIMDMAKDSITLHKEEVMEFETKLQKVYEYEKNRPKNEITLKMWDLLLNPEGHLLGGFLNRWKTTALLSPAFITNEKKLVSDAFDQIAGLESHKIKTSEVSK